MRIAGPIVLLVCGILALVGLFLAWFTIMGWNTSGWNGITTEMAWQPLLVLIGSILLLICSITALVLGIVRKARGVVIGMGITSVLAAVMVLAGPVYILIDYATHDGISIIGVGIYLCIVAAIIAFIFGILTAAIR
jgi:heme/copper-type cytochrome/quinol oxidase subunit 3